MTDEQIAELEQEYRDEIERWDWEHIKQDAIGNPQENDDGSGDFYGFTWIGSVYAIMPSGKYYMPWTSNQTEEDVEKDEIFYEVLEEIAKKHGMWLTSGGESDHIYLGCELPEGWDAAEEEEEADDDATG